MTQEQARPAVLYAAKSTEDKHGSNKTQLADAKKMADREGWEVVAQYDDESASAWKGDRGPGLAAAMEHVERLAQAHDGAILVVQHSDRLARGDAVQARHLVEVVTWAVKVGVTIRSVQDDLFADPRIALLMGATMGQRNTEDSTRKSKATRAGLRRRKDSGAPVGPVPLGYTVESKVIDEEVIARRVVDPSTRKTVERIFALVESGATFGEVARALNADGVRTRPRKDHPSGHTWVSRTVRNIVHNRAYVGEKGYPRIIGPDRFEAIHANLARLDPVRIAKRKSGRKPRDDSFFLRGIGFCLSCGGSLYTRRYAAGRVYVCRHGRDGSGLCSAPPIPAQLIESHVLRHLDSFVGSVEDWLSQRIKERHGERQERERALVRQRAKLTDLDRVRERHLRIYNSLADEGKSTAYIALEEVERLDRDRAEQEKAIQQAEAVVSEWAGAPDVDAALDYYTSLVDHVQGRIRKADGAPALNEALSTVLAGLWAEIEEDRERLLVEFELVDQPDVRLPDGSKPMFEQRPTLPPRHLDDQREPESLSESETRTLVNRSGCHLVLPPLELASA